MKKTIAIFAGNFCHREREKYYFDLAYKTGKLFAEAGYIVLTGAGTGLMDEALRGAIEAGGETIGIVLNKEGRVPSKYLSKQFLFDKLNPRQDKIVELADAYVALPGGIGTMYEISAILALKRAMEMDKTKPLILLTDYFDNLFGMIEHMRTEGFVDDTVATLSTLCASPEEALQILEKYFQK